MIKKITIALLLTMIVLAFPVRLLAESPVTEAVLKIFKAVLFITLIVILMKQEKFLRRQIVLKSLTGKISIKLLPVVLVITLYNFYFFNTTIKEYQGTLHLLMLAILGTFLAASAEEIIFRGYIFNLLKKNKSSFLKSLITSSILFSVIHIVNFFRFEDAWSIFNQLTFSFTLGLLLGSIYGLTNNLWLVSSFHFLINIPTTIRKISESSELDAVLPDTTLTDNLLSTLFFIGLMIPVLLLASYYIRLVNKKGSSGFEENQLSAAK